jgi:hypothetical protein
MKLKRAFQLIGRDKAGFDANSVKPDSSVDAASDGHLICKLSTKAEADRSDLPVAFRHASRKLGSIANIPHSTFFVETIEKFPRSLHALARIWKFSIWAEAPVEIGREHQISLFGKLLGNAPYYCIDAEYFLEQDNGRSRGYRRLNSECAEFATA